MAGLVIVNFCVLYTYTLQEHFTWVQKSGIKKVPIPVCIVW